MARGRDIELDSLEQESAAQYAHRMRKHFALKADHNKRESLAGFTFIVIGTLAVSGFVAFGTDVILAKIVPLCLSLTATAVSTWLHFRRPHQLWGIYRSAQRYVENNQVKHRFGVDEYGTASDKDALLAKAVAEIALAANALWVPLIPSPEGLEKWADPRRQPWFLPRQAPPSRSAGGGKAGGFRGYAMVGRADRGVAHAGRGGAELDPGDDRPVIMVRVAHAHL
jgi:hypothetical protein